MKLRKFITTIVIAGIGYYLYKKTEELEIDNDHIDRCRNNLIAEGYEVKDSYTLNLVENSYLMFYFEDNGKNYEVRFDKENDIIEYIKEV